MTLRDFERRLKKLNHSISIYATSDESKPAGVWIMIPTYHGGEYEEVAGIEKWNVQEFPVYSAQGKMLKGGWHRVLQVLVGKKYIDRQESYKYFGYWDEHKEPFKVFDANKIDAAINQLQAVGYRKIASPLEEGKEIEVPIYNTDDAVDIGRMIAKDNKRTSPPPSMETGLNLGE